MDVRLTTLGNPSVHLGEEALPSLPGKPISFGLLVFLGMERESTRDRLIYTFWPESSQERARHTLSQALYELRQELGEGWVESSGNMVRATDALRMDAVEFEAFVAEGRRNEALELYAGHFLDGVHLAKTHPFEEWVEGHRSRLSRRHRAAVDAFIGDRRDQGDLEAALTAAWKWVGLDPLDDGGQHYLIQLLAETGGRAEALAQFERCEAMLESELGLEPLEETLALVEGIRKGSIQPALSTDRAPGGNPQNPAPEPQLAESWPTPLPNHPHIPPPEEQAFDQANLRKRLDAGLPPSLQLLRPIGHGSMADVFLAREPHLKRLVAVKVMSPHLNDDPEARKRFEREAQAAARLNHPNICTVHSVGSLPDGTPFLVSPFVKGTTLAQRLTAEGRLDPEEVRQVIREVASALAAAHQLGIIHRDVRPDNVLREDETGRHFLCDFGIAGVLETGEELEPRITKTGEVLGHPAYLSPEQRNGKPLTDRADVYSLGVMAHQLLTGHPPPPAESLSRLGTAGVITPDLAPLKAHLGASGPKLVDLISRCLASDPSHRPAAGDISRRCEEWANPGARVPAPIPGPTGIVIGHLIERRFLQIIGAYIAGSWLFLEAADQLEGRGLIPQPSYSLALTTAIFGFLATNILAWYHGQKGRQNMTGLEKALLALMVLGWVVACGAVFL